MHDESSAERLAHSRQEAAAAVGVPVSQIDAAIKRGDLQAVRIGKHIRIPDSALRRFAGQEPAEGGLMGLDDATRERIARVVADWPPLTAEERALLRRVLAPQPTADGPSADAA